jgi:hypothetical protein
VASKVNSSLFTFKFEEGNIFILIYVDDIIITASELSTIEDLQQHLHIDFVVKELGDLHYLFGIEVQCLEKGILLPQ